MASFTVTGGGNTSETVYTFEGYNRKTETVTENGTVTASKAYAYDAADRLTEVADHADPAGPRTTAWTYDLNGNTVSETDSALPDGAVTYTYDALDRMVQAYRGPPGAGDLLGLYDYNHEGMRIRHRFGDRGDVDTYYDGGAVLEERHADTGLLLARYRYGNRLLSLDTGADKRFYHTDGLGSTIGLTDPAGQVDTSYLLDPWGRVLEQTGNSLNRQIFTGQEHDEKTGLIYFGARYYDPDTGRFTTQDSYPGEIGTPPSLHRYLYAYGNPTVYVDLYGYAAQAYAQPTFYPETDIFGPSPVRDTGYQLIDELWAGTDSILNFAGYLVNAASGIASIPTISYAKYNDISVQAADEEILGYMASSGPLAPYLLTGYTPFRASPTLSYTTRALRIQTKVAAKTSAVVIQRSVQVVQKTVPVVTREIRSGMKSLGRGVIQVNGGRLNPLNYKVEGLGSNLGNLKYAGSRGGRSWNFVDEVTEELIALESREAIQAARLASKRGQKLLPAPNKVDYSVIPDPKNVGPGKNFTLKQKQDALKLNRQANQGVVQSDTSAAQLVQPQKSQKGVTPDPLEWQFDHKIPKNQGGTNSSSNLQIISRQDNRYKWDN